MAVAIQNPDQFKESIENAGDKLVVIDFYANWCGPCKILAPTVEQFAERFGSDLVVIKVDVDDFEDIANEYNISSMPTLVFIKKGEELDRFSGTNSETLESLITKHTSINV